ncbi:hypothetical protein QO034_23075, partial [Sedimentitalea sp. JM2-8]|nr:hypothetical protein [Sedimentitalea xiamensis]
NNSGSRIGHLAERSQKKHHRKRVDHNHKTIASRWLFTAPSKVGDALVDRARAETLVFRLARQERDVWVTWPARVAALIAADISAEVEKTTGVPATLEPAILHRVLETHVREQLDALADLRVSLG